MPSYVYAMPLGIVAKLKQGYNHNDKTILNAIFKESRFVETKSIGYWRPIHLMLMIRNTTKRKVFAVKPDKFQFKAGKICSSIVNPRFTMEEVAMMMVQHDFTVTFSKKHPCSYNGYYIDKTKENSPIYLIYDFFVTGCKSSKVHGEWFTLEKLVAKYFEFNEIEKEILNYLYKKNNGTKTLRF